MAQANNQPRNIVKMTAAALAAKAQSKYELYTMLSVDASVYLPNYDAITIYHLKDLFSGTAKRKS